MVIWEGEGGDHLLEGITEKSDAAVSPENFVDILAI